MNVPSSELQYTCVVNNAGNLKTLTLDVLFIQAKNKLTFKCYSIHLRHIRSQFEGLVREDEAWIATESYNANSKLRITLWFMLSYDIRKSINPTFFMSISSILLDTPLICAALNLRLNAVQPQFALDLHVDTVWPNQKVRKTIPLCFFKLDNATELTTNTPIVNF